MKAELLKSYVDIKEQIVERLAQFEEIWAAGTDAEIFAEFAFCLLTPQSKATVCWDTIQKIIQKNILLTGSKSQIRKYFKAVRFYNNKTEYFIEARTKFYVNDKFVLRAKINEIDNVVESREFLVKNIKGFGYKEASHFLRNIGKGYDIAILDRHILKNLKLFDVLDEIPKTLSQRVYFEIENKMRDFATKLKMPMSHLDILLWVKETGKIFK